MNRNSIDKNLFSILAWIIIVCYLSIGFIPNLDAVDKIAPQWVGMSLLNLVSICTFYVYRNLISN